MSRCALLWSCLAAAACGASPGAPPPPEVELAGQDPEVSRAVEEARARVLALPEDGAARLELAMVLDANDLDGPAESAWSQLAAMEPENARAWYHLARMRERRGDVSGAEAALGRALALAPEYAPARARLGRLLLESGRLDEAQAELERARGLDPLAPAARMGLARLSLLRDRPRDAIALLEPLRAQSPREPYVNGLLARAHAMLGDSERAGTYLREEENAGSPSGRDPWQAEVQRRACGLKVRVERARSLVASGNAPAAWEELEPLRGREDELVVLDALCEVLLALGQPGEVLERTERSRHAHSSIIAHDRILALRALGQEERALAEADEEARGNPAHPNAHATRGQILFALERHAEAVAAFEAARERGDRGLATAIDLARARAAGGDLAGGLRGLEEAAAEFPWAPKPWAYRSELLALDGRPDEARASLEEARQRGLEPELVELVAARLQELAAAEEQR